VRFFVALRILAPVALLGVAACGRMGDLEPAKGQPLPVKPLMAKATPTPEELLTPPVYAAPDRVDELMKKSVPRSTDKFDLPPPSGQAPRLPAESEDEDETNQVGPVTPQ
jgi:hypothetical protein